MSLREVSQNDAKNDAGSDKPVNEMAAIEAGLKYVTDRDPGFRRKRKGKGFFYLDHENNRISHDGTLHRIKSLVIPPAWDGVWICRFQNGHMQATGRDQRERKQYRYHSQWSQVRNETKFSKLSLFGECLPKIRARLKHDLQLGDLSRDMVLAAVIRIMEKTMIRVGNDEYASENKSYGLTTIHNKHVDVHGGKAHFHFKGKSGVIHDSELVDPKLSALIKRCQELPGQELFAYLDDDGLVKDVGSEDVNRYLREITEESITAKDFRTWGASAHAISVLHAMGELESDTQKARKARELEVIKSAADYLGNTVSVCRKYYVHPAVFAADESGLLEKAFKRAARKRSSILTVPETALLDILSQIT